MSETPAKRNIASRLKALYQSEGIFSGIWLLLRFLYCWIYSFRFKTAKSFFVRGSFSIRGARHISIGTLRAGNRISIEAVERYGAQTFLPSISIGDGVCFSSDIHIGCTNRVEIGNGVLLGSNIYITDHDHGVYSGDQPHSSADLPPAQRPLTGSGTVVIEDNVHVGEYVTILKNVRIGRGSIIGAHSNVTRSIPAYTIAAGNPARPLKRYCHATMRWLNLDETK